VLDFENGIREDSPNHTEIVLGVCLPEFSLMTPSTGNILILCVLSIRPNNFHLNACEIKKESIRKSGLYLMHPSLTDQGKRGDVGEGG